MVCGCLTWRRSRFYGDDESPLWPWHPQQHIQLFQKSSKFFTIKASGKNELLMLVRRSINFALMSIRVSFIPTSHILNLPSKTIRSDFSLPMNIASGVSRVQIDCWLLADECFMFMSSDGFTGRFWRFMRFIFNENVRWRNSRTSPIGSILSNSFANTRPLSSSLFPAAHFTEPRIH